MNGRRLLRILLLVSLCLGGSHYLARAATPAEEFKVKRAETYEFASAPAVTRDGDRVTVVFESKAACDATVAVETTDGKIVRHLASGVLGENAPAPFQKSVRSNRGFRPRLTRTTMFSASSTYLP